MSAVRQSFANVKDAAKYYIQRGWQVVPLAKGTKQPEDKSWLKLIFKPEDFRDGDNIGLRSVNGMVDVDCDAPEVVAIASAFLPPTGAVYGRISKPRSHWLYLSPFDKTVVFKDLNRTPDKATLLEIRSNHQSMAPPSLHPIGEVVTWDGTLGDVQAYANDDLMRYGRILATGALTIRYYNSPGNRHDWSLALCGTLLRFGMTEEETLRLFAEAARVVADPEIKDRLQSVRSTYSHDEEDPIKAHKALKDSMGEVGSMFLKSLQRIWGSSSSTFVMDEKTNKIVVSGPAGRENVKRAIEKVGVELKFDIFSQRPILKYPGFEGTMQDPQVIRLWFTIGDRFGFLPTQDFFTTILQDLAWCNQVHPIRNYFKTLNWDQTPRIDRWLVQYAGAADTEYVRAVSAMMLIASVRRVLHPGCKFDEMVILESEQGQLKSTALRTLCAEEDWFSDDLPLNVDSKEVIERTRGKWIIEAGELSGMRPAAAEHLKSMLSRQLDGPVRMAYAHLPIEQARQFIIIGTTNSHQYLTDTTGNRRFWPIRVKTFDIAKLRAVRDQLWAEAVARESAGESIRLDPKFYSVAALQQERRRYEDQWEPILDKAFPLGQKHRLTHTDIWMSLGISAERRGERETIRMAKVMQHLGFRRLTVKDNDGHASKGWARDAESGPQEFTWDEDKPKEEEQS